MSGVCYDTSIYISYRPAELPAGIRMSAVVLMELTAGARDDEGVKNWERYRKLAERDGTLLVPTGEDWWLAGKVLNSLQRGRASRRTGRIPSERERGQVPSASADVRAQARSGMRLRRSVYARGLLLDTRAPRVHFLPMPAPDPDASLRAACFAELQRLCKRFGKDVPYKGGLDAGFRHDGRRVPFLNYQKGIYRAACQRGPAALSINTSWESTYDDDATPNGFSYAYRRGDVDQPDNRALRAAGEAQVPLVYFVGTRPGWYHPAFPAFVIADHPEGQHVILGFGEVQGLVAGNVAQARLPDEVERVYALRQTRVRVHQARFRGLVLPAYRSQCAICRLKEERLLDAAHIVPDRDPDGVAAVRNGLSLCSIHHRAFDEDLVGISPDFEVHVARRLLEEEDGPMLDLLKTAHQTPIVLPERRSLTPDRELLARRFETFLKAS